MVGSDWSVAYRYDFLDRLDRVTTPYGAVTFAYRTGQRTVVRDLPNGVRTFWRHRPDGQLEAIEHIDKTGALLLRFTYDYCPNDRVRQVKEEWPRGGRTVTYRYDTVQQLVGVEDANRRITFAYDLTGNQVRRDTPSGSIKNTFNGLGQLTASDGRHCAPRRGRQPDQRASSPASPTPPRPSSAPPTRRGGRSRTATTATAIWSSARPAPRRQRYLPDPRADTWQPLRAVESRGGVTHYVWVGDVPLLAATGSGPVYFLEDHLGSVRCVVNAAGAAVEWPDYDAFGTPLGRPAEGLRPGFAGLFYDAAAGVYLTRARAYDPAAGRFLQPDPEHRVPGGRMQDLGLYTYCGSDPVKLRDIGGMPRYRAARTGSTGTLALPAPAACCKPWPTSWLPTTPIRSGGSRCTSTCCTSYLPPKASS